ncbi:hypothetical protein CYMTET_28866 [Cymbomonas tetramitiformis]|uniref:Uncharacterized protein n=1 Tax=Cymbomonas tetramitiformis TaxID=36881 RepID=A0AAE0FM92_9CHLO|nr:hypothetical protein CYMTET_28866 [Cymbomonas tetramitiformis]
MSNCLSHNNVSAFFRVSTLRRLNQERSRQCPASASTASKGVESGEQFRLWEDHLQNGALEAKVVALSKEGGSVVLHSDGGGFTAPRRNLRCDSKQNIMINQQVLVQESEDQEKTWDLLMVQPSKSGAKGAGFCLSSPTRRGGSGSAGRRPTSKYVNDVGGVTVPLRRR